MSEAISLLTHGFVRLVDHMGSDLSIVRAARTSYDAVWRAGEDEDKDAKLIDYLMKNHHTSPFEMVQFVFEVKAPIFVFRQWHRHRTQSINEVSGRYSELPEEYYVPEISQITTQSLSNKQMRTDDIHPQAVYLQSVIADHVLPVNTFSHMFTSMNLHNLFHFLRLRLHEHAQYEIRVYAEAMLGLIEPIVPVATAAFKKYNHSVK